MAPKVAPLCQNKRHLFLRNIAHLKQIFIILIYHFKSIWTFFCYQTLVKYVHIMLNSTYGNSAFTQVTLLIEV